MTVRPPSYRALGFQGNSLGQRQRPVAPGCDNPLSGRYRSWWAMARGMRRLRRSIEAGPFHWPRAKGLRAACIVEEPNESEILRSFRRSSELG